MNLDHLKAHIDDRLDKLETKLDDHLERIAKAEVAIEWIKGHIKIGTSIFVATLTGMASIIWTFLQQR